MFIVEPVTDNSLENPAVLIIMKPGHLSMLNGSRQAGTRKSFLQPRERYNESYYNFIIITF